MTSILLSCICAVALGAASPSSRADTTDVYVIDYVDVKDSNGTQLVGKTISTYNINLAGNGSRTVRRHTIKTVLSGNTVKDGTGEMSSETAGLFRSTPEGKDTTNVFIIDNVVVKGFNGFQLNGKTISAYEISLTDTGARMVRTHMIKTVPMGNTVSITTTDASSGFASEVSAFFSQVNTDNAVFVINGEVVIEEEFLALEAKDVTGLEELRGKPATELLKNLKEEGKYDGETEGKAVISVTARRGE